MPAAAAAMVAGRSPLTVPLAAGRSPAAGSGAVQIELNEARALVDHLQRIVRGVCFEREVAEDLGADDDACDCRPAGLR